MSNTYNFEAENWEEKNIAMRPCRHFVSYFYRHFCNVESLELLIFPLAVRHSISGLATLLLEHWLCAGKKLKWDKNHQSHVSCFAVTSNHLAIFISLLIINVKIIKREERTPALLIYICLCPGRERER